MYEKKTLPEYPSNSHKSREQTEENSTTPRVEKVIVGEVKQPKKSYLKKFIGLFISDDIEDVKSHVIFNIVIPAIKHAISDAVDVALLGENGRKKPTTKSYTNYSGRYISDDRDRRERERYNVRDAYEIDDIILDNYGDADLVLDALNDRIEEYGMATVADLYDALGVTAKHTDYNYGWNSIRTAKIVRVRNGYMLDLPRVIPLRK